MKRLISWLLFSCLLAGPCFAQEVVTTMHNKRSVILAWDAVPLPTDVTTGEIKYQVYISNSIAPISAVPVGTPISTTELTINTFTPYTPYYFGVRSEYWAPDATLASDWSVISWSIDTSACSPAGTFGNTLKGILLKPGSLLLR